MIVPRRVALVSVAVALSLLGDSLLYVALPLQAPALGVPTALVGVLLGANRLVRLASNNVAPDLYRRYGGRLTLLAAVGVGAATTAAYALPFGFWPLLGARLTWGICWSCLRLGGHLAVLDEPATVRGRLMGAFNAISRSGSLVAVAAGGFLVDGIGYGATMLLFGALTLLGLPFALVMPPGAYAGGRPAIRRGGWRQAWGETGALRALHVAAFALLFVSSGLVTSTLSLLVLDRLEAAAGAATIAGLLLAVRFFCDLALSVPLGHLSDRLGRRIIGPAGFAVGGLLLIAIAAGDNLALLVLGVFALFAALSGLTATLDAAAGDLAEPTRRAEAMGRYTTWLDAGSALGPIVGYLLVPIFGIPALYAVSGLVFLALAGLLAPVLPGPANHKDTETRRRDEPPRRKGRKDGGSTRGNRRLDRCHFVSP